MSLRLYPEGYVVNRIASRYRN